MAEKVDQRKTFLVQVLNEQNGTMQGVVTWTSTGEKRSFRSVMELIHLMDSVEQSRIETLDRKVN